MNPRDYLRGSLPFFLPPSHTLALGRGWEAARAPCLLLVARARDTLPLEQGKRSSFFLLKRGEERARIGRRVTFLFLRERKRERRKKGTFFFFFFTGGGVFLVSLEGGEGGVFFFFFFLSLRGPRLAKRGG